ncbi:hypothetical protein [Rhizobacter sp. Root1221]|uniref:hypothetical protein n=1 Tax=Rhizobacter sp. Root1221 TaxID=1736433 RepID=UPI000701DC1C|nr:hypothetical protein [Rhizobacter sp. Root1221]
MTEGEMQAWVARRKPLAFRRIEKLLAQITAFIAWSTGNKDFEFDQADLFSLKRLWPEDEGKGGAEVAAAVFSAAGGGLKVHRVRPRHERQKGVK